jgi:flagellar hook-associated protein 3 FlgL
VRITNSLLQARALRALQQNLGGLERAAAVASSGLRIQNPSDDPVGVGVLLRTDHRLAGLTQYQRNIQSAETRLAAEENALETVGDLLTRARELAISQATAAATPTTRSAVVAEVAELRKSALAVANTSVGGAYLFGGAYTDRPPLDAAGALSANTPASESIPVQIGENLEIPVTHAAAQVFQESGAIAAFDHLITALGGGSSDDIAQAGYVANAAFVKVQSLVAEVGARGTQLSAATENIEAMQFTLTKFRADVAEVDIEAATMELVNRQTALQAALMATSKALTTSLADYL